MKILFKNKTKYTKIAYQKYLQFHQNKYGVRYKFTTIVTILLLCFCIITNLKYSNYYTTFLLIFTLIGFCFYRFFYPIKKVQKEIKTEKFEEEKEFTFTFYEKYFTIYDKQNIEQVKYWKLYKVYESNEFFYLYIDKDHAFLLEKSTFVKGNTSDFFKFLKKKTWYKILQISV